MTSEKVGTVPELGEEGVILKTSPPKKSRGWCFTWNNYDEKSIGTLEHVIGVGSKYIYGIEKGESGTPHLQGYIWFKSARHFEAVKKLLPKCHIEKAKGTKKQNFEYCSKDGQYFTNMNDKKGYRKKLLDSYESVVWRPWQQQVIDIIEGEPDARAINWVHEPNGNAGKSFLAKYLVLKYGAVIADGKKDNVFNQINDRLNGEEINDFKLVVLDMPRYNADYVNYGMLEAIKNGMLYSGKYKGGVCLFDTPHLFVFSNVEPDYEKMSIDRWNVIEI